MKKKIANAVELVFLIVAFVIMNLEKITKVSDSVWGEPYKVSLLDCIQEYDLYFVPMCIFFILCAVMCIVSIISKSSYKDGKAHIVIAIILFISTTLNTVVCTTGDEYISFDFPYTVLIAIMFAVVVVACAKRSSLIADSPDKKAKTVINKVQETTNADELKKFKELLDSGAITQEEFDAKKKELLGL